MFKNQKDLFNPNLVFRIGLKLLTLLEEVHQSGYVYNDLNLENIMTDYPGYGDLNVHSLKLIDFGFATKSGR